MVEITLDSEDALGAIARTRGRGDVSVLAGTVRTAAHVDAAVAAGAEAVVGPGTVPAVLERAGELGVPAIPGALTPTEIERGVDGRRRPREALPRRVSAARAT